MYYGTGWRGNQSGLNVDFTVYKCKFFMWVVRRRDFSHGTNKAGGERNDLVLAVVGGTAAGGFGTELASGIGYDMVWTRETRKIHSEEVFVCQYMAIVIGSESDALEEMQNLATQADSKPPSFSYHHGTIFTNQPSLCT